MYREPFGDSCLKVGALDGGAHELGCSLHNTRSQTFYQHEGDLPS